MIFQRIFCPCNGKRIYRKFHREQGKIFPERFIPLQSDPFVQKPDLIVAVQDPGVGARLQRDLKALDICPEMINAVARPSEHPDLLPVQAETEPQGDLCI